jgi:hypothetical protein
MEDMCETLSFIRNYADYVEVGRKMKHFGRFSENILLYVTKRWSLRKKTPAFQKNPPRFFQKTPRKFLLRTAEKICWSR